MTESFHVLNATRSLVIEGICCLILEDTPEISNCFVMIAEKDSSHNRNWIHIKENIRVRILPSINIKGDNKGVHINIMFLNMRLLVSF